MGRKVEVCVNHWLIFPLVIEFEPKKTQSGFLFRTKDDWDHVFIGFSGSPGEDGRAPVIRMFVSHWTLFSFAN